MKPRTNSTTYHYNNPQHPIEQERKCEWLDCKGLGEFRAPRSRDELNSYRWFCLEHVRLYNKSWNYYDGMDDAEVEQDKRHDTVWQRPSWKLGMNAASLGPQNTIDPFDVLGNGGSARNSHTPPVRPPITKEEEKAYKSLGMTYPVTAKNLKSRYKELVKAHHPDTNRGSKTSEEKIKEINRAYHILQDALKS